MMKESHSAFLLGPAGADKVRHSGRTLYAHLCGTHDLLREWGNRDVVSDAGAFHSIYGTRHFRHQAWPLDDRKTIVKLIGPEAEKLAYAFCTVDRPRALFEPTHEPVLWRLLREIEAANLIEQGSKSRWLQRLHGTDISEGARRAIEGRS
jgi:hypothetical protein